MSISSPLREVWLFGVTFSKISADGVTHIPIEDVLMPETHRRVLSETPLCVYAGLREPEPEMEVTDDVDAVTCRDCLMIKWEWADES